MHGAQKPGTRTRYAPGRGSATGCFAICAPTASRLPERLRGGDDVDEHGHQHCRTCTCATGGVIRWRPVVIILLFVAGWDVCGLLVGDGLYLSPSYDVLREVAALISVAGYVPGMRLYGAGLAVIGAALTYGLLAQRRRAGSMSRMLSFTLSCLAAWWVVWCSGIALAFLENGQVHAWGSLGKLLGISAIAIIAARVPPPASGQPAPPPTPATPE